MTKDQIRLMVYRQIKLQHPEYSEARLQLAVQETYDLIIQVEEATTYAESQSYVQDLRGTGVRHPFG